MRKTILIIDENLYQITGPIITNFSGGFLGICSKEEKNKVKAKIDRNNKGNLFKSERLNQIAEKNPLLKSVDIFEEILDDIENVIPSQYRETFYENLQNLSVNIIKSNENSLDPENSLGTTPALYRATDNTIFLILKPILLRKQMIDQLVNEGKLQTPFHEHFKRLFIHEMFHLSSSRYDIYKDTMYSGISPVNSGKKSYYTAINEGITEMLSRNTMPNYEIDINIAYNPLVSIVEEFADLIGIDAVLDSYYTNDELKSIRNGLLKVINDKAKVDKLIDTICKKDPTDLVYDGSDPITRTQTLLFEFYKRKIQQLHNQGKYTEAAILLQSLKSHLSSIYDDPTYSIDIENNAEKMKNAERFIELETYVYMSRRSEQTHSQRRKERDKKRKNK